MRTFGVEKGCSTTSTLSTLGCARARRKILLASISFSCGTAARWPRRLAIASLGMLPGPGSPGRKSPRLAADTSDWPTGTFSGDATDFETSAFRQMYWLHTGILLLLLLSDMLDDAYDLAQLSFVGLDVLGVIARAGLHVLPDQPRARRIGIATWATINLVDASSHALDFINSPRNACRAAGLHKDASIVNMPLWIFFLAIMNSTFGLSFSRKSAVLVLYLVTWVLPGALKCRARKAVVIFQGVVLLASSVVAHCVEIHARRRYMRKEKDRRVSE